MAIHQILCNPRLPIGPRNTQKAARLGGPLLYASRLSARRVSRLHSSFLELSTLPFTQTTPDAEAFIVGQRVLEALAAYVTGQANLLGLARRTALFRKERLWIGLRAQCALLPAQCTPLVGAQLVTSGCASSTRMIENPGTGRTSRAHRFGLRPFFGLRQFFGLRLCTCHLLLLGPSGCAATRLHQFDQNQI